MENLTVAEPTAEVDPILSYDLYDYAKAKIRIDRMITSWLSRIIPEADKHRLARYVKLDVEQLRQHGDIEDDETFIPERVIDSNIIREKADAMAFLNSSNRLAYFRCVDDPVIDTRGIETDLTKGLTYTDWYKAFDRNYDSAALHGWSCIEVVYDQSKPLKCGWEFIAYDKLYFNLEVEDIQQSELVIRKYRVSTLRLDDFVRDNAFDAEQVALLTQKLKDQKRDDEVLTIYKIYFKFNNCVYVAWYSREGAVTSWLKAPEKYICGIREQVMVQQPTSIGAVVESLPTASVPPTNILPAPIQFQDKECDAYPIFLYLYRDDEQEAITDHKGRGFLDLPLQEAFTSLKTSFVNGTMRASNIYASPKEDTGESADIKQLDCPLENGIIFSRPMIFFNMPYPDPVLLNGLQMLDQSNSKSTGKIAASVSNRKDSRKTATELDFAQKEESRITSTNLATYSEFLRQLFSFAWLIVQSQALEGTIQFALKGTPDPMTGEMTFTNDVNLISKQFDIRAAGDVDVIQKQKQSADMQQDWPVLQATALAPKFLEDYIRLRYPTKADEYIAILQAGDMGKQIISSLLAAIQGLAQPTAGQELADPGNQDKLAGIVEQATAYLAAPV